MFQESTGIYIFFWVLGLLLYNLGGMKAYVDKRKTAPSNVSIQVMFAGVDLVLIEYL